MPGTPRPGRTAAAIARSEALRPVLTELVAEGLGCRAIAHRLTEAGYRLGPGGPVTACSVRWHLRRLQLQTAHQAGTGDPEVVRAAQQAGYVRAAAGGHPIGRHPATDAARQRRSEAAAAWRAAIAPTLQALAAAGCSRPEMVRRLAAAGVTTADGRPINQTMVSRACAEVGIVTPRSGPRRKPEAVEVTP